MAATAFSGPGGMPRVNLMPRSEIERRRRRIVLGRWAVVLIAALAVVTLVIAAAFAGTLVASTRLAAEQNRSTNLLTEIGSLSEVSEAIALEKALLAYREQALADDIAWVPVLETLLSTVPAGGRIAEIALDTGSTPEQLLDDPLAAHADPAQSAEMSVGGGVTVTIISPSPLDVIAVARAIRELPIVIGVEAQRLAEEDAAEEAAEATFLYSITVLLNQTVYTERFVAQEGE